jgi:hypothetical protein
VSLRNTAPTTSQGANSGRTDHRRQGKRKVSDIALTPTGHIIARDCLLHAPTLHWEGDINDQCEACDEGGTLTECTRCNLVWHASCLRPTPTFPLRPQDAIVCGEQCWSELTTAALSVRSQAPTRETHTTKRRFLTHKHHTANTTHSFPLITCAGHKQQCAATTVDTMDTVEQPAASALQSPGSTDDTIGNMRTTRRKATLSKRITVTQRTSPPTTKRAHAAGTLDKRAKKRAKPTLSAHINPWTISSGLLRAQSLRATTAAAAAREMPP